MNTDKPRSGVLAVPESYQKRMRIEDAASSLQNHFDDDPNTYRKVSVGVGIDDSIVLYVFTKQKIDLPDTWEGYTVTIRNSGKAKPIVV